MDTVQHQKRLLCHQPVDISTHHSSYLKNNCLSSDLVEKIGTTATTEHDIQPTPAITTELETTLSGHQPSSPASAASRHLSKFISVYLEGPGAVPMADAQPQSQLPIYELLSPAQDAGDSSDSLIYGSSAACTPSRIKYNSADGLIGQHPPASQQYNPRLDHRNQTWAWPA